MSAFEWFVNTPEKDLDAIELFWQLLVLILTVVAALGLWKGGSHE